MTFEEAYGIALRWRAGIDGHFGKLPENERGNAGRPGSVKLSVLSLISSEPKTVRQIADVIGSRPDTIRSVISRETSKGNISCVPRTQPGEKKYVATL